VTMALTQTQWRIVVESVWATAQAVRQFISCLTKERVLVSVIPTIEIRLQKKENSYIHKNVVTQNRQTLNDEKL